jgi:CheY-like chemotaxis protein
VSLESIVEEVTGVAGPSLAGTSIKLQVHIDKQLPRVLADAGQLNQLVMNLFLNARDAIKAKFYESTDGNDSRFDGTIQISVKKSTAPVHLRGSLSPHSHGCIKLMVTDSGVGISEETKNRIFDPFFTTKPFGQGSGLGLSVVYGIVRKLHGAIEVESTVGKRTAFTVYLPITSAGENLKKQPASSTIRSFKGNARILVVDQDPLVQDIVSAMLDELGYQVITCNSGAHALDVLEANSADVEVLLTDAALPDMTWMALAETVHRLYPTIKLLLSCHQGTPAPVTDSTSLRVSVLQKPYKLQDLARTIWSVVKGYYADGLVLTSPRSEPANLEVRPRLLAP